MARRSLRSDSNGFWLLTAGALLGAGLLGRYFSKTSLAGKNALVTGGSRGLGLELARVLVEKGANVAIIARDLGELTRAEGILREHAHRSVRVVADACDLSVPASIEAMLERVRAHLGPIDVLVNNAGLIQVGPLESMTVEDFERTMRLHYFAPLELMLRLREDMRARGGGRIANIASIGGLVAVPHLMPYSGSKFALVGLSRGMRAELAKDGIAVTTVAPGLMRTGSPRNASFKGDHQKEYAWFRLSDSLPLVSMSSRRAARRIVLAIERGEAELAVGLPAKLAALAGGLMPGVVAFGLGLVERLLPTGRDPTTHTGAESESSLVPKPLTLLTARAEIRNNQR